MATKASAGVSPATAKTERLLNLVIALLHTRQPLSKAKLRQAVPDYAAGSVEAVFAEDGARPASCSSMFIEPASLSPSL